MALSPFDGPAAQRLVEPARRGLPPVEANTEAPRAAAALAYVFERDGVLRLPLTVRRQDLPEHKGQVSLPGGRPLLGEAPWATACREASEEIGLAGEGIVRLGSLAPVYIPVTHTILDVHVALGPDPGELVRCPREVERIVIVHLAQLADPACLKIRRREIVGIEIDVPYFDVGGLFLWGATAMALSELVERIRVAATGETPAP